MEYECHSVEQILHLYHSKTCGNHHEGEGNSNEPPGLRRNVRMATRKEGQGKKATFFVGDAVELVELDGEETVQKLKDLMEARMECESQADFLENPEHPFDPIPFYFACHKTKVPRDPVVVINDHGQVFFYWERLELDNDDESKDDKLRLVPSLWSLEQSQIIVRFWKHLTDVQKRQSFATEAAAFFGVPPELPFGHPPLDNKFDRVFLTALAVYLVRTDRDWVEWRQVQHPRGEPDWVNIVLGHLARSSEWQAYWRLKFLVQR